MSAVCLILLIQPASAWVDSSCADSASFSWGDAPVDLGDTIVYRCYMTPVRDDQGTCQAQKAFALCGAVEAHVKARLDSADWDLDLSEQSVLSCIDGFSWCEDFAFFWPNIYINVHDNGIAMDSCFEWGQQYDLPDDWAIDCELADCDFPGWGAYHIYDDVSHHDVYENASGVDIDSIKEAIVTYGPVIVDVVLDSTSFADHCRTCGIYDPDSIEVSLSHWVVYYGWDDDDSCWLAKNSYRNRRENDTLGWGERGPSYATNSADSVGFFRMAMGQDDCETEVHWIKWEEPSRFSWAEYPGDSLLDPGCYVTPARSDQSGTSACGAFTGIAAVESAYEFALQDHTLDIDLSEQWALTCMGGPNCDFGSASALFDLAMGDGIPAEVCFPWGVGDVDPCDLTWDENCDFPLENAYFIDSFSMDCSDGFPLTGEPLPVNTIKGYISDYGPVAAFGNMGGLQTFSDRGRGADGVFTPYATWGHYFQIYGWDDADSCWLCKNSLGPDWGEPAPPALDDSGFFRLRMDVFGTVSEVYYNIKWTPIDDPVLSSPPDDTTFALSGLHTDLTWSSPASSANSRICIYRSNGEKLIDYITTGTLFGWYHDGVPGDYKWHVRFVNTGNGSSRFSEMRSFTISDCCALRGDIDHNGFGPDISDLIYLATMIGQQGPEPPCGPEADVNGDDAVDISDVVYLSNFMFQNGPDLVPCPQ
jgi:hypothetical protein